MKLYSCSVLEKAVTGGNESSITGSIQVDMNDHLYIRTLGNEKYGVWSIRYKEKTGV